MEIIKYIDNVLVAIAISMVEVLDLSFRFIKWNLEVLGDYPKSKEEVMEIVNLFKFWSDEQ